MTNILFLYHTDQPYILFHYDEILKHSNIIKFNYADYFRENGPTKTYLKIEKLITLHHITHTFIFLYEHKMELKPEFINGLRLKSYIVFWFFDDEILLHSHSKYYAQCSDVIVTTDFFGQFYYNQIGLDTVLYFSSFPKTKYHPMDVTKDIDVSFVGRVDTGDRLEYLSYLQENGINVHVYGEGSKNGSLSLEQMVEVFSRSKINLNFTKTHASYFKTILENDPLLLRNKQNKGRPIELALCKSFCLSEEAPSLKYVFDIEKEVDIFSDKNDLLNKIKFYLTNEHLRKEIEMNAYQRASAEYEASIYIKNILIQIFQHCEKKTKREQKILYKNKLFIAREIGFYLFKIYEAIRKKRYRLIFPILQQIDYSSLRVLYQGLSIALSNIKRLKVF